jgi:ArsR family transcriptional regulator
MAARKPAVSRIDLLFRAFSDGTRLRILSLLQAGECCVGDMAEVLGIEQPSVSRHLAYLRRSGLVSVRKAGLWSFYSLTPAEGAFHAKLLECLSCCFGEVPQIRQDAARAQHLRERGGCCPEAGTQAAGSSTTPGSCCADS